MNWRATAEALVRESRPEDPWPVVAKKLLTERERSLYQSLANLYSDHKLFVQVALSQLIDVDRQHPERESIRARYKQLVADFVLCRADLSVVAVIELDDRTHLRADRQAADGRKNKVLADAGIRLVRIPAGPLPTADLLRKLIDADGMGGKTDPEETVLTLAEDVYAPASAYDSAEPNEVSHEFKRLALKAAALAVLLLGGWIFSSYVLPTVMQNAFAPLAMPVHTAMVPQKARGASPPISSAPTVAPTTGEMSAEAKRVRELEILALGKQKNLAFAAFYSPPASCEHPFDWSAQVECGNKYIRAKRAFELKWAAEHASNQGNGTGGILDNPSVAGDQK